MTVVGISTVAFGKDIYLPEYNLWVSDYPYLRRDIFLDISRKLGREGAEAFVSKFLEGLERLWIKAFDPTFSLSPKESSGLALGA